MLIPSVALASGDLTVIWWVIGGSATYILVGAILLVLTLQKKIRPVRLVLFAVSAAVLWYVYLELQMLPLLVQIFFMLVAPLVFLIALRRR